jgi:ribosomal protein S18 acetylase RimI-like enzyme
MDIRLREAQPQDADAVASLLDALGYPSTREQAAKRLERIGRDATTLLLVAEVDGEVAGFAGLHVQNLVEADAPGCVFSALVVAERFRRLGIGARLTKVVEAHARERGCKHIVLSSAHRRTAAHAFYEALGYEHSGRRYRKTL